MAKLEQSILENIYKSALRFLGPLSLEETYKRIVDEAVRLVGGKYGALVFRQNGEFLKIYASSPEGYLSETRKRGFAYRAFIERKSLIANVSDTVKAHPELKEAGIRSTLHIPLSYRNKAIGVLIVNSRRDHNFSNKDLEILNLFGSMASLAIRQSQLNHESEKALQTRDLFISMASHELRTPLTTISGYAQLLVSRLRSEEGITKKWMDELAKEVDRLTILVKELLEISRIKSGNLNYFYKEANILEICDRAIKTMEFGHPEKTVSLENKLGNDNVVVGDYDKLLQAVSNILENAAKYSPDGKDIRMILTKKNNQLRIVVKDKGIGIPSSALAEIFKGYVQGKNHTREGLGLGLFLTKSIIEKHQGRISIKSKENGGTTVEVLLPRINMAKYSMDKVNKNGIEYGR